MKETNKDNNKIKRNERSILSTPVARGRDKILIKIWHRQPPLACAAMIA